MQEKVEIGRRLFEQWATGDLTADCIGPDIEYLRIGAKTPDMEGRWLGLDEVSTAMRDYLRAFSDLRIEAERIIDLSGTGCWCSRGTLRVVSRAVCPSNTK